MYVGGDIKMVVKYDLMRKINKIPENYKKLICDESFISNCFLDSISTTKNDQKISKTLKDLQDLKILLNQLKNLDINTDLALLLRSTREYKRIYHICINKEKLFQISEEKYIIIHTRRYGKVDEAMILQEHIIGKKEYVISPSSPTKNFKLAFSN